MTSRREEAERSFADAQAELDEAAVQLAWGETQLDRCRSLLAAGNVLVLGMNGAGFGVQYASPGELAADLASGENLLLNAAVDQALADYGMTAEDFDLFATRIRGNLVALAGRFTRVSGIAEDAEDIVQESLTTLWGLLEKGYPVRDAEAMAVRITKTRCIDYYRRRRFHVQPDELMEGVMSATRGIEQA